MGLTQDLSLLAISEGELVAASVVNRAKVDRSRVVPAEVRKDYKEGQAFGIIYFKLFMFSDRPIGELDSFAKSTSCHCSAV